ncbi:MAG: hypothetical protein SWO11_00280 [Thermodesulfobacteriota bacterium]|nr:hypothetical protein [Thermodesulfobacteriota bacterium]
MEQHMGNTVGARCYVPIHGNRTAQPNTPQHEEFHKPTCDSIPIINKNHGKYEGVKEYEGMERYGRGPHKGTYQRAPTVRCVFMILCFRKLSLTICKLEATLPL